MRLYKWIILIIIGIILLYAGIVLYMMIKDNQFTTHTLTTCNPVNFSLNLTPSS
jgi:uncharacterized membrane protein